ncbi:MAG TPA: class I SAM-dependent methyltransferase [Stenomitos sp.]
MTSIAQTKPVTMADFDPFARMYNEYWGPHYCTTNLPILETLLLNNLPTHAQLLDLCCGTGQLLAQLSQKSFHLTGLDASAQMLHYAALNAPQASLICNDILAWIPPSEQFDAVLSTSASLNHILTLDDLSRVFRKVYQSLISGGTFLFEFNLPEVYQSMHAEKEGDVREDYAWASICEYDGAQNLGQIHMTLFTPKGDLWQRQDRQWPLRGYTYLELQSCLEQVGFQAIAFYDAEREFNVVGAAGDTFCIARKPSSAATT